MISPIDRRRKIPITKKKNIRENGVQECLYTDISQLGVEKDRVYSDINCMYFRHQAAEAGTVSASSRKFHRSAEM
jgi:hypothetical protein